MDKSLIEEIVLERAHQLSLGFDAEHDDKYEKRELLKASICYATETSEITPKKWPWPRTWWKPRTIRENLIRAIALMIAHIESTDRRKGSKDW